MVITTFMEFVSNHGRGVIAEWYEKTLPKAARVEFDGILRDLAVLDPVLWQWPEFKALGGGLSEIRFKADKIEYRVFGRGPKQGQYAMLIGAFKKKPNWYPHDAEETARRRLKMDDIEERIREYEF